jgi:BrnA antitoxin of type II toxin-antitoxin system
MPSNRPTAASRKLMAQYHELDVNLRDLETDLRWGLEESPRIPEAWRHIALTPAVPQKRSVTMRLDEDVLDFFKAMGRGYLTRMNDVLRAFMQARLAGVLKGTEDMEYQPTTLEIYLVEFAELIQHMSRRNARRATGLCVVEDDVETDRRKMRLMRLSGAIPPEYRIDLNLALP